MKNLLRIKTDIHGRHIYTDEQMSTYIAQFEKDFQEDTAANQDLRIINATEGGVKIANTQTLPLSRALEECYTPESICIPETKHLRIDDDQRHFKVKARLELVIRQLVSIENNSQKTLDIIDEAQADIENPGHVDRCISRIHTIRDDVMASEPGFGLVNFINQKGGLDRFKVDRQIALLKDLSEVQRQGKQLERDANNVRWVKDSAIQVRALVERALAVFADNAQPMTRDEFADETALDIDPESQVQSTRRVEAVIFVDPDRGPLGTPRALNQLIYQGLNALELTIKRLARSTQIDGITIITPEPDRINAMHLNPSANPETNPDAKSVRVVGCDPETFRARAHSVGQARLSSSECWRSAIGSLGCYDESLESTALARVMDEYHIDAAAIISSDAPMIDPQLVDQIIAQHRADPEHCRIPFSQAVPGLGCAVLDRDAAHTLAHASQSATVLSSIGAMLGDIPVGPQGDPIASPLCANIDPLLRDAGVRVIPDSTLRLQAMTAAYQGLGDFAMAASTPVLLKAYCKELKERQSTIPSRLVLELSSSRAATGLWGDMHDQSQPQQLLDTNAARELITQASAINPDITLLFTGRGDPLNHPDALELITHAKESGIQSIELRTDLLNQSFTPEQLAAAGLSVLSVDVLADTQATYESMTGSPNYEQLLDQMQSLFNARISTAGQLPLPWVLPRITRCDEVYNDIQNFYDRWLTVCGCATIDPPPPNTPGRIQKLEIPSTRANQLHHNTLHINADGQVVDHNRTPLSTTAGPINAIALGIHSAYTQMRSVVERSSSTTIEPKANTQPAYTP